MRGILNDLRQSLRALHKAPGFALIAVGIMAIGIGSSTTIFSWVRAVLLNPLPGAANPQRVVALESIGPDGESYPSSYLDFRDLRQNCKLIASMSVTKPMALPVGDRNGVERVWGEVVSGNFFDLLGIRPEIGRFFSSAEVDHQQNAHPLLVISHSYWTSHYNADPHVLGSTTRIGHFPYTIIGVAPQGFHGSMPGLNFEMWAPATMYGQLSAAGNNTLLDRKWRTFRVVARLAPGVSIEQARAEVESHARDMARDDADTNQGMSATLLPFWKSHYGVQDSLRSPLGILGAACIVVLLIVCANVENMLLVRTTARLKEFSIRMALGAPRMRLIRHVLTESLMIAAAGSLAGLVIAMWLSGSLGYLIPRSSSPRLVEAPIDAQVFMFAVALALVVSLLVGMVPALHGASGNVNEMLKEGARSISSTRSSRLRGLFVTAEVALAVVGIIGAGLFLASFRYVSEIHPGFDPQHVAIAQLDLSSANYNAAQAASFYQRYGAALERQPGISAVAYSDYAPLSVNAGSWEDLQVEGYVPARGENMKIYRSLISPGYFSLMKIPLLEGRDFTALDNISAPPVMIVNQEFVRRFVPGGIAIGRKVQGWGKWFTIVGVAQDSKVYRLTEARTPYFYVPMTQIYRPEMGLIFFARTSGSMSSAVTALRGQARAADPTIPVFDTSSLDDFISESLFPQRIASTLLSVLGFVSLLLAAVGLYVVMANNVAQRTNEIGIRMALGAQPGNVARLVMRQGMLYALAGLALGAFDAALLARIASSALVGISPLDPAIYAGAGALTIVIALASMAVPAWRAVRVDPLTALRHE
jgi:putative ABC transport system permease protein